MRTTRLLGILFFVAAAYAATRGHSWSAGYIALGAILAFGGLVLLSRRGIPGRRRSREVADALQKLRKARASALATNAR